jgi:hypothetical protein
VDCRHLINTHHEEPVMTRSDRPDSLPQRSTRAPAEGADERREDGKAYDHAPADHGGASAERDSRDPVEGRPDAGDANGPQVADADAGNASPGHAGSGNSLGDGRTAGGAQNESKRDRLSGE